VRRITLIALAAFLAGSASAQPKMTQRAEDHLVPDGILLGAGLLVADYDALLRDVLHAAYEPDVALHMIAQPAFASEYAVGLRGGKAIRNGVVTDAPYRIFGLTPDISVWAYHYTAMFKRSNAKAMATNAQHVRRKEIERAQASISTNPRRLKVSQCETGISHGLGARIEEVWRKMLMGTRYPAQNTAGQDGAIYSFSMYVPGLGPISGNVWSPERNSSTGTLVALANEIYGICTRKKDASMDNLERLTAELEHRLK
jgi:hypothetical protein